MDEILIDYLERIATALEKIVDNKYLIDHFTKNDFDEVEVQTFSQIVK